MPCTTIGDTTYFVFPEGRHDVYHCPTDLLFPSVDSTLENGSDRDIELIPSLQLSDFNTKWLSTHDYESAGPSLSPRGLHANFTLYHDVSQLTFTTLISFHPINGLPSPRSDSVSELILNGPIAKHPLSALSPWLIASSSSGMYTAVILDMSYTSSPDGHQLYLVRFAHDPPGITSCQLTVPFYINLEQIYSLGMDERCGVLYLSHFKGHLFALPFA